MLYQPNQLRLYPRRHHPSRKHQQGVVIVVALFIVALVATMAYVMMARLERDTRRTSLILRDTQAALYAEGSLAWAMDQLRKDWEQKKPRQIIDPTPIHSPSQVVNGYQIKSTIYDVQGRFNINNLRDTAAQASFKRLMMLVDPALTEPKAQAIMLAVVDWISPGGQQNEWNKYYMMLAKPYRAAHRPMVSASELRLVKGMTPVLFNALQPYVVALPQTTLVNVKSAPAPVLSTLSPTMSLEAAKAIERLCTQIPIASNEDFFKLDVVKNHQIPPGKVTTISHYFLVKTEVVIEKQHLVLYTLLERATKEAKANLTILWQSKGIW